MRTIVKSEDAELHAMAAFVHSALIALHGLSIIYNIRRKNKFDIAAHVLGVVYSVHATAHHLQVVREHSKEGAPQS